MTKLPNDNECASMNKRLDVIISILLNKSKVEDLSLRDKIRHLISFDLDNNEIASILQTTYSLVAKERSLLKRVKKNE